MIKYVTHSSLHSIVMDVGTLGTLKGGNKGNVGVGEIKGRATRPFHIGQSVSQPSHKQQPTTWGFSLNDSAASPFHHCSRASEMFKVSAESAIRRILDCKLLLRHRPPSECDRRASATRANPFPEFVAANERCEGFYAATWSSPIQVARTVQ